MNGRDYNGNVIELYVKNKNGEEREVGLRSEKKAWA